MVDQAEIAVGRNGRARAWVGAALVLVGMAGFLAFLPAARGKTVVDRPERQDIGAQWVPFSTHARAAYRQGHFPLWDPHDLCGMPFLAFPHTGGLYLPAIISYLAAPAYAHAAALDIFVHLALAAIAALALFKSRGQSPLAAWCLASAYAFSGFVFGNINFPPTLHTAAILPLWFLGTLGLLDRPRLKMIALAALALAAMVFAGDFETIIYALLGLGFEFGLRVRARQLPAAALAALAAALVLAGLAALPQIIPTFELYQHSIRAAGAALPIGAATQLLGAPVFAAVRLLTPAAVWPDHPGSGLYYLGAFFTVLAAGAVRTRPMVRARLLIFPCVLIYFIVMYVPPFTRGTHYLPLLGSLIVPFRIIVVAELYFLLAAGEALDDWLRADGPGAGPPPLERAGAGWLVVLGTIALAAAVGKPGTPAAAWIFGPVFAAAGALALVPAGRRALSAGRLRRPLAVVLVLVDFFLPAAGEVPMTDPGALEPGAPLVKALVNTAGRERYLVLSGRGPLDFRIPFHLGMRINADTIDTYIRMPPLASAERLGRLYPNLLRREGGALQLYDQWGLRDPQNLDPSQIDLINRMNVVWLLSAYPWEWSGPELDLVAVQSWPDFYVYKNNNARPRAYQVSGDGTIPCRTMRPAADRLEIEAVVSDDIYLSESWDPGWRAEAGGEPVPVRRDELNFIVIPGAGGKRVTLRYVPLGFRVGLWAGIVSLAALAAAGIRARRSRLQRG